MLSYTILDFDSIVIGFFVDDNDHNLSCYFIETNPTNYWNLKLDRKNRVDIVIVQIIELHPIDTI